MLGGALVNAGQSLKVVSAQDLVPRAIATAPGMLMGFAMGIAAVLYVGVGWRQESIGLDPAVRLTYLLMLPGALVAFSVLPERRARAAPMGQAALAVALAGAACRCATGSSTALSLDARGRVGESQWTAPALPQACAGAASS